ncbi:MAG: 23S rRNA (adenine(2503)-C(2))-methyltransferase RlmN, partial [Methylocella sp.]
MSMLVEPLAQLDDQADRGRASLAGATRRELAAALAEVGVPEHEIRMRVAQLWHWIYHAGATSFDAMGNVGKVLRAALAGRFTLARPKIVAEQISRDGTRKWLLRLDPIDPRDKG